MEVRVSSWYQRLRRHSTTCQKKWTRRLFGRGLGLQQSGVMAVTGTTTGVVEETGTGLETLVAEGMTGTHTNHARETSIKNRDGIGTRVETGIEDIVETIHGLVPAPVTAIMDGIEVADTSLPAAGPTTTRLLPLLNLNEKRGTSEGSENDGKRNASGRKRKRRRRRASRLP